MIFLQREIASCCETIGEQIGVRTAKGQNQNELLKFLRVHVPL